ncbi:MAG: hypothetical protein R3F43_14990 [bacterium]
MGRRAQGTLVLCALALLGAAPRDPVLEEAERLARQAEARGRWPAARWDLLRLDELSDYLPTATWRGP